MHALPDRAGPQQPAVGAVASCGQQQQHRVGSGVIFDLSFFVCVSSDFFGGPLCEYTYI